MIFQHILVTCITQLWFCFVEIVYLSERNEVRMLEKRLTTFATNSNKPITKDIEEALLQAVLSGADEAISPLILAGARRSVMSHVMCFCYHLTYFSLDLTVLCI